MVGRRGGKISEMAAEAHEGAVGGEEKEGCRKNMVFKSSSSVERGRKACMYEPWGWVKK